MNTNEEIDIHVGEIQINDNVINDNKYNYVTGIKPINNHTLIRTIGDDILQLLGKDVFENDTLFQLTNYPNYYLRAYISTSLNPYNRTFYKDMTYTTLSPESGTLFYRTTSVWYSIDLTDSNKNSYSNLWRTYEPTCYVGGTGQGPWTVIDDINIPLSIIQPSEINYRTRLAFDFKNKVITLFSPYQFRVNKADISIPDTKYPISTTGYYYQYFSIDKIRDLGLYYPTLPFLSSIRGNVQNYYVECINSNNISKGYYYNYQGNNSNITNVTTYGELPNTFIFPLIESISYNPTNDTFQSLSSTGNNFRINQGISQSFSLYIDGTRYYGYNAIYQLLFNKDNDTTPYPDPNPEEPIILDPNIPIPDYNGGNGEQNISSDNITMEELPSFDAITTGSVRAYKMSNNTLSQFFSFIWTDKFFNTIIKLFTSPFDAIISLHILPFILNTSQDANIKIGNVGTDITAGLINSQYSTLDCGSISIEPFYNDASDYETIFHVYLAGIGYVQLNTYEIMNSTISLKYNVDVLTGDCIAYISVDNNMNHFNSTMYQQAGNIAQQIPLSSYDYSSIISASLGLIGAGRNVAQQMGKKKVNTASVGLGVVGAIADAALSVDITLDKASNLAGNNIMISQKQCYLTRIGIIHNIPTTFSHNIGYPINATYQLSQCKGFTKCLQVHVENVIGTAEETEEIYNLLRSGVIF